MRYELIIKPRDGGFCAICPLIPGLLATGATPGATLDAAFAELTAWLAQRGEPPPTWQEIRAVLAGARRT